MGPLEGITVIEFAGIGPGPFCAMMLADMGAEVIRVDRADANPLLPLRHDVLNRGRRSIALDLKQPADVETALRLIDRADALIEGFRPGVMEKLGIGPDVCLERNGRLVYGRVTGWGQEGPLAQSAGHDINYVAISGALHAIGTNEAPVPPLNLVGDFGGGGMLLAFGIVCALLEARTSVKGQVVDAAMTDGAASLMAMIYGMKANGLWDNERASNLLDGGAPFYGVYRCADGKWISIGSLEPKFYTLLLAKLGLDDLEFAYSPDRTMWPKLRSSLETAFTTRTRDEWTAKLAGTDICFAPVLDLDEAPLHPHNAARETFVNIDGVIQPAPAPRFSRTQPEIRSLPPNAGQHTDEIRNELI